MKILIITPAPAASRKGNRVTAVRWGRFLRDLGHRVAIRQEYRDERCDVLIALHARRSFAAVERFRQKNPRLPCVVALTGTDLYDEIRTSRDARQVLDWATRLVVLQPLGIEELPQRLRSKARVIYQSAPVVRARRPIARAALSGKKAGGRQRSFQVCVMGHLRPVKDPFRTAMAARLLPASSRIRVRHLGAALSPDMADQARAEAAQNPRYRWLGDLPRWRALRVFARSQLLVLTSRMEGGANALSEAIAASVPVLASKIPGSVGFLGPDYPGYFPVENTQALAKLLDRAETDARFYRTLATWCKRLRPLIKPARERDSWRRLLSEFQRKEEPSPSSSLSKGTGFAQKWTGS